MANRMNRYKAMYQNIMRYDTQAQFPRHVFTRAANARGSY